MDEVVQIPIGYCKKCEEQVPVMIQELNLLEITGEEDTIEIVYCPVCDTLLNTGGDFQVEWYDVDKVGSVTNFKPIMEQE